MCARRLAAGRRVAQACPASRPWRATSPSCDSMRGGCRARRDAKPGQVRGAHRERQRGPVAAGVSRHASRINILLALHDDGARRVARAGPRLYAPGAATATQSAPGYARCDADGEGPGIRFRPVLPLPAACDRYRGYSRRHGTRTPGATIGGEMGKGDTTPRRAWAVGVASNADSARARRPRLQSKVFFELHAHGQTARRSHTNPGCTGARARISIFAGCRAKAPDTTDSVRRHAPRICRGTGGGGLHTTVSRRCGHRREVSGPAGRGKRAQGRRSLPSARACVADRAARSGGRGERCGQPGLARGTFDKTGTR